MRTILIDDELDSLESLDTEIRSYCPELEVVATCHDPRTAVALVRQYEPELLFLDIEMPHLNGFELLQELHEIELEVIFVTAYDAYAVKAFEFNAADYILKPVMKSKLVQAVQKVCDKQNNHLGSHQLKALINNIHLHTRQEIENIALPTSEGFEFVHVNEITYLQSDSNYTWVHLGSQQKYLLARTLKDMASMIPFPQFFRAHQSYYVNLNHARKYVRGQGGYLVLKDGTQIPVSRANKDTLMRLMMP
jgi:two-component system LytT family response regulator